jgi:signal transduction histidine kinase
MLVGDGAKFDLPPNSSAIFEALKTTEERSLAGQLALEIMHEVRNPLEALGYLVYLAEQEADKPNKVREYMRLADEQIRTVSRISRQTLEFANDSDSLRPVELVPVAEAALRIHRQKLATKNIQLIKDLREDAVAPVHQGEMLQVISNLILNAVDALPDNGVLCLRLRKVGGEVKLTIADNGHGIAPQHRTSIFEPFFTTKSENGTGLGLALTKRIIDRHRGTIRVRSSVLSGKSGSIFRIALPVQAEQAL